MKKLICLLVLTGCATPPPEGPSVQAMTGPNGKRGFSITCAHGVDSCYQAAGEACITGYTVVSASQRVVAYVPMMGNVFPVTRDNVFVECK